MESFMLGKGIVLIQILLGIGFLYIVFGRGKKIHDTMFKDELWDDHFNWDANIRTPEEDRLLLGQAERASSGHTRANQRGSSDQTHRARQSSHNSQKNRQKTAQNESQWAGISNREKRALLLLGLLPNTDEKTLQKAYRKKMMEFHPDRFQKESSEVRQRAERAASRVNEAREILLLWLKRR